VGLYIDGSLSAEGKGKSKKQAEQTAAMNALKEGWNEF
jgi:dsRNA-specific ribonuclease